MFQADAYTTMPVKRKKRPNKPNSIQKKLANASYKSGERQNGGLELNNDDVKALAEETNLMVLDKISFLTSLFYTSCICRRDRK